jgi:hypothetical protein
MHIRQAENRLQSCRRAGVVVRSIAHSWRGSMRVARSGVPEELLTAAAAAGAMKSLAARDRGCDCTTGGSQDEVLRSAFCTRQTKLA